MDDTLLLLVGARQPFTTRDAAALGVDRHALATLARTGVLVRVDHGAYVPTAIWRDATAEQRHLLRCRAVLRGTGRSR